MVGCTTEKRMEKMPTIAKRGRVIHNAKEHCNSVSGFDDVYWPTFERNVIS